MAKTDKGQDEAERVESLVKDAECQGLPRPVAEDVVDEVIAEDVAPDKLKEVVEETARIEKEDREQAAGEVD